ncbi:MAG: hypothetical protein JRN20_10330 [Nitrososphaerota archaeon]|nr:hypothetical protein [Nitrososphaerota archaeon]
MDRLRCIGCGKDIPTPTEENKLGDEFICDPCREEMISSLEGAWKRHSAFLDSALN